MAEVLKPDEGMFTEIMWYPINGDEGFPTPPQEFTQRNHVGFISIEIDPAREDVRLNLGNASDKFQHIDLWYADQIQEEDDFSSLTWQLMAENVEIDPGQVLHRIDSGEKTGTPPQNVFRRFYLLRPAGLESSPMTIDSESNELKEAIQQDASPGVEEQNPGGLPTKTDSIRGEWEAFTMEDAEKFVADEHASGVEADRHATCSLMAAYARKAWQVDREGVLVVARELSEAPRPPLSAPVRTVVDFSVGAESAQEQRVEMVFARIHPDGTSEVTGRDAHGEPAAWTTERDFRLLNGVRDFTHNEIHWTVFILPSPVPDDEAAPLRTLGPPPEGVFAALANYYDTHLERLEAEQTRNDLIREAREAFQEQHVPSRPVRVLNFWKVEGAQ